MSDKEEALEGTAQSGQMVAVSLKPISAADSRFHLTDQLLPPDGGFGR